MSSTAIASRDKVDVRRIAAILTVHNRRPLTLECLAALREQNDATVAITPVVVDDGSTDGTAEAVRSEHPEAVLLRGDGSLFWNGGMHKAYDEAMRRGFDFYLWLNDDTTLDTGAVRRLLSTHDRLSGDGRRVIVVGSTREPDTGQLSYGGAIRPDRRRPLHFERAPVADIPQRVDTMNGNCVLIPAAAAEVVGNVDPAFLQKLGDFDYGLRAAAAGVELWTAPGTIGACATHPPRRTDEQPLADEVRRLWSDKELPSGPWRAFAKRWGGPLWPLYFASPYVQRSVRLVRQRIRP